MPAYIRPLFCEGKGPFRWAALSGDPSDIAATDEAMLELFPENERLARWITLAQERVQFQGLPARICWLGYGERHRAGLRFNEMVATGELSAPIVIGRDHLDCGSVASPYRETEAMKDGSDAIADWPLLNALVNTASGATWVSIHHGGGVGIGRSHPRRPGDVADGTALAGEKLERVLTNDPAMGVIRHVDAGYDEAIAVGRRARHPDPDAALTWTRQAARRSSRASASSPRTTTSSGGCATPPSCSRARRSPGSGAPRMRPPPTRASTRAAAPCCRAGSTATPTSCSPATARPSSRRAWRARRTRPAASA